MNGQKNTNKRTKEKKNQFALNYHLMLCELKYSKFTKIFRLPTETEYAKKEKKNEILCSQEEMREKKNLIINLLFLFFFLAMIAGVLQCLVVSTNRHILNFMCQEEYIFLVETKTTTDFQSQLGKRKKSLSKDVFFFSCSH